MFTRSRFALMPLVLAFYSQIAAADGVFTVSPIQVGSHYEVCTYPLCNPARGSVSGTMEDGKTIEAMREEGFGEWSLVIGGFSSDPGPGYLSSVGLSCDNTGSGYDHQDISPVSASYNSGRLYVYLLEDYPYGVACWLAGGPNTVHVVQ